MKTQAVKRKRRTVKKTVVEKVGPIRIRETRPGYFVIRIRRDGLNHYETFDTLDAARLKAEQLVSERTRHGLTAFEMDRKTRSDATDAVKLLKGRTSLVETVKFWATHHPDESATSMTDLADLYLADLERRKCRPRSIGDMRHRLNRFNVDYGDRPACTITSRNVLEWLGVRGRGPVNQDNFRRAFRACFNFARKRGIVTINPIDGIEAPKKDATTPEIWTAAQVESCLRAAQAFSAGMVPMLAVMAFAGLRPDEAAALRWENVSLTERSIKVQPATSKTRKSRLVEITDNLSSWLAPYHKKAGPIAPAQVTIARWRVRLAAIMVLGIDEARTRFDQHEGKKGTEIKGQGLGWSAIVKDARKKGARWPQDVLRHSYASHWLPVHHDKARLAGLMGNSPDVIERHYKALVSAKEAAKYWTIEPTAEGRIIKLMATA